MNKESRAGGVKGDDVRQALRTCAGQKANGVKGAQAKRTGWVRASGKRLRRELREGQAKGKDQLGEQGQKASGLDGSRQRKGRQKANRLPSLMMLSPLCITTERSCVRKNVDY